MAKHSCDNNCDCGTKFKKIREDTNRRNKTIKNILTTLRDYKSQGCKRDKKSKKNGYNCKYQAKFQKLLNGLKRSKSRKRSHKRSKKSTKRSRKRSKKSTKRSRKRSRKRSKKSTKRSRKRSKKSIKRSRKRSKKSTKRSRNLSFGDSKHTRQLKMKKNRKLHKNYVTDTLNSRKRIYSMPGNPTRRHPRLIYADLPDYDDSPTNSQLDERQARDDEIDRQQQEENEALRLEVENQIRNAARQAAEQRVSERREAAEQREAEQREAEQREAEQREAEQVFPTTPPNSPPRTPLIGSPGYSSQHRLNQAGVKTSPDIKGSPKRKMPTQPGEDEECPICLQNLAGLETKQCKKQCGKFMCKDCWRGNLQHGLAGRGNDCPMCRQVDAFSQSQQILPSFEPAQQPYDSLDWSDDDIISIPSDSPNLLQSDNTAAAAVDLRPESPYRPYRAPNITFSPTATAALLNPPVPNAPLQQNRIRYLSRNPQRLIGRSPTPEERARGVTARIIRRRRRDGGCICGNPECIGGCGGR